MGEVYLFVGLGNPGTKFENTRHNVGFDTIDYISVKYNIKLSKIGFKALYGEGSIEGIRTILVKPQTFMNLSGESVREIVDWYKLPLERLIVIYDDIDLEPGKMRVRPKGSSGTHNGMKSIIYQLQDDSFPRVRIGIGRAPEKWDLADYVLSKFSKEDRQVIDQSIVKAAQAAIMIAQSGTEKAMNSYNK
ncbi:aminoacyl-tRNA hydrolase [Ruminiclostridium cellulolyticum]|uniref:Peptidyl-tRNA hydrolase n=1 Tax=Ruminiclostridium cellulolyticum (strain ATCC 35319 / DSM 5812 / JCM 6584 / H10) TaxID=394503 RepID=B8I057_RUMCH|nr:aminoacyl-tRNA hydrolase [Ruminiclostridium cellulolyticum]ACL77383.1 peptidyl-tRNA hydrolase [Ruminiclostridium cellulolyticum H10]